MEAFEPQEVFATVAREFESEPPLLPIQLTQNPNLTNSLKHKISSNDRDPHMHVTLNHTYSINTEDREPYSSLYQFGISHRYKKKLVTMIFYVPREDYEVDGENINDRLKRVESEEETTLKIPV